MGTRFMVRAHAVSAPSLGRSVMGWRQHGHALHGACSRCFSPQPGTLRDGLASQPGTFLPLSLCYNCSRGYERRSNGALSCKCRARRFSLRFLGDDVVSSISHSGRARSLLRPSGRPGGLACVLETTLIATS
jgi:hypothetical protein